MAIIGSRYPRRLAMVLLVPLLTVKFYYFWETEFTWRTATEQIAIILFFSSLETITLWADVKLAQICGRIFFPLKRATALVDPQTEKVFPSEVLDSKKGAGEGGFERLCGIDAWLTHYPLDYSYYYDYQIDPQLLTVALSKLLGKIPQLGGRYSSEEDFEGNVVFGINYRNPVVMFTFGHGAAGAKPNFDPKAVDERDWYDNFCEGVHSGNGILPLPQGMSLFRPTLTHFDDGTSMLSIGGTHGFCDGDGFYKIMRCWAAEMRDEKYEVPTCSRSSLLRVRKWNELQKDGTTKLKNLQEDDVVLGKSVHATFSNLYEYWSRLWLPQWPCRFYTVRSIKFTKADMNALKASVLKGNSGEKLKGMRLSTNDIVCGLFWKLRATINNGYSLTDPIKVVQVINTRKWLPEIIPKNYCGNALCMMVTEKRRCDLIQGDLSDAVYAIRSAVTALNAADMEKDMLMHNLLLKNGMPMFHNNLFSWVTKEGGYVMDRDLFISNLLKLDSMTCDFGSGNPIRVKFHNNHELVTCYYLFKWEPDSSVMEWTMTVPVMDTEFYDKVKFKDPSLDWEAVNQKWVREPWTTFRPIPRLPRFNKRYGGIQM